MNRNDVAVGWQHFKRLMVRRWRAYNGSHSEAAPGGRVDPRGKRQLVGPMPRPSDRPSDSAADEIVVSPANIQAAAVSMWEGEGGSVPAKKAEPAATTTGKA